MDAAKVNSAPPVQATQAPKKTEQVRKEAAPQENPDAKAAKAAAEKPRPNVNGQGQVIGTRLSVTA